MSKSRAVLVLLLLAVPVSCSAPPAAQMSGSPAAQMSGSPARPVPGVLHGSLVPVDPDPLPASRDTTDFNEFIQHYSSVPWFMSIDIRDGFVVMGLAHGLQVWDARTRPASPTLIGRGSWSEFPVQAVGESKWPGRDISLPPKGVPGTSAHDVVAHVGESQIGLSIWSLAVKHDPRVAYQQPDNGSAEVYAATLIGRHYAFLASKARGLMLYDMTKALTLNRCVDDLEGTTCPGVQQRRIGDLKERLFVDGAGNFVVVSGGVQRGVEIFDVSSPLSPRSKLNGLTDISAYGVALFRIGSRYYLGLATDGFDSSGVFRQGRIYDVTCITSAGGCSPSAPKLLWKQRVGGIVQRSFVTHSEDGATHYLYFGNDNRTGGGRQREFLMNVSDPANPSDLTPPQTAILQGVETDYWSWYYAGNPTGFTNVGPRRGAVWGGHFYRAGWSIFDIHRVSDSPPPVDEIFSDGFESGDTSAWSVTKENPPP